MFWSLCTVWSEACFVRDTISSSIFPTNTSAVNPGTRPDRRDRFKPVHLVPCPLCRTPLHCAASCNNVQVCKFLVESGAAVFATTYSDMQTAADKCEEMEDGYAQCSQFLYGETQQGSGFVSVLTSSCTTSRVFLRLFCACGPAGVQEKMGVMNRGVVYALWDYEPQNDDELGFSEGDCLTVLRRDDEVERDWWWARCGDHEGYIPRNLLGVS